MRRINREPRIREPREAVEDSREIREHIFRVESELGQLVFGERTVASSLGSLIEVVRVETEAGDIIGYLPIYAGFTP